MEDKALGGFFYLGFRVKPLLTDAAPMDREVLESYDRMTNTVCRRSLCTVELSRLQEALPREDWFIPAPEPESSPLERGIQN